MSTKEIRVLNALDSGYEAELIATASVIDDNLLVTDCNLKDWQIPFNAIPVLADIPPEQRSNFEIDEDGSYLYWPTKDIHIDLETLRASIDQDLKEKLKAEKILYDKEFGGAIPSGLPEGQRALVRKQHNLKLTEIQDLSERQLKSIEQGEIHPTLSTLDKLASAHQMSLNDYLEKVAQVVHEIRKQPIEPKNIIFAQKAINCSIQEDG